MEKQLIGIIAGILIFGSNIPYATRIIQGKIKPKFSTWLVWTVIGLSIMLTYQPVSSQWSFWAVMFDFVDPLLIIFAMLYKNTNVFKFNTFEIYCMIASFILIAIWAIAKNIQLFAEITLYIAIATDLCAAIPQLQQVIRKPEDDRPFAWGIYACGHGLAFFATTHPTTADCVLLIYMFCMYTTITIPLVVHRIREKISWKKWI